jgi:hypothetical protein
MWDKKTYFVNGDSRIVKFWSSKRLPFESNTSDIKSVKKELKTKLLHLDVSVNNKLKAIYISEEKDFVDVENVLFYNVGICAFPKKLKEIHFERKFSSPKKCSERNKLFNHYCEYELVQQISSAIKEDKILAKWEDVKFSKIRSNDKAESFWYNFKKQSDKIKIIKKSNADSNFGIELFVKKPNKDKKNVFNLVKPMLDGLICSFHNQKVVNNSLIDILHDRLGCEKSQIQKFLEDKKKSPLWEKEILKNYGKKSIKWNPADDVCTNVRLVIDTSKDNDWHFSGTIFLI